MTTEKVEILFKLGPDSRNDDVWHDYLQYGFDEEDVDDLLELIGDAELHQADIDSNDSWVPMHAWRALGQIGSEKSIEPLLDLFEEIVEDDWALSEYPIVMSMIGEAAIEPLTQHLREAGRDEFSRVMAADALKTIAENYPQSRERIIRVLTTYLDVPDTSMPTLNGLVVVFLVELKATESLESIRRLYKNELVDISCAGELKDVEAALKPSPDTETGKVPAEPQAAPIKRPNSDDVFELLTYYLERYGNDDSVLDVSELDGYFTALSCSPTVIHPSQWLDAIWGGEQLAPKWPNTKAHEEFIELCLAHYQHVEESLEKEKFEAIYLERDDGEVTHTITDEWCAGFLRGIDLWPALTDEDAEQLEACIQIIEPFATEEGWEKLDALNLEELKAEQAKIEPAVITLSKHFEEQRKLARTPIKREEPKVGRNDPCPCGSGKKYKKCCLNKG